MSGKTKLILATVVVSFLGGLGSYFYMKYEYTEDKAEGELTTYLAKMYSDQKVLGKSCTGRDTDGDGYISCDARVQTRDGREERITVECAAVFLNSGCKTKQMLPGSIEATMR